MNYGRIVPFVIASLLLTSCGSRKELMEQSFSEKEAVNSVVEQTSMSSLPPTEETDIEGSGETENSEEDIVTKITRYAKEFLGTGYRYGGTGSDGFDCSGLVHTAFSLEGIKLPRTSREMAAIGEKLELRQVINGDLLFFQTNPGKKAINHVGLVVDVAEDVIYFIHSTTSRGVIISSLTEKYWQESFVTARRIQQL